MVDIDYSENLHHIHLWATQQEWFRQIQSTLFILMAYFINPNTGVLEIMICICFLHSWSWSYCGGLFYRYAYWFTLYISQCSLHFIKQEHVQHYIEKVHKLINNLYTRNGWGKLSHLFVWSDNCLEQFKNQWMLGWAINFGKRNERIVILNYVAPLHGKRTVDGEGFLTLFIL